MAGITRRRKGEQQGMQSPAWSHPAVGADISASEVPADAVPGVGSGHGTLERSRNKSAPLQGRVGKDLQAQGPAPRLRPEPGRSAPPPLARSQDAGADRQDAAKVLPGAFLPDRPAVVPASGQTGADA